MRWVATQLRKFRVSAPTWSQGENDDLGRYRNYRRGFCCRVDCAHAPAWAPESTRIPSDDSARHSGSICCNGHRLPGWLVSTSFQSGRWRHRFNHRSDRSVVHLAPSAIGATRSTLTELVARAAAARLRAWPVSDLETLLRDCLFGCPDDRARWGRRQARNAHPHAPDNRTLQAHLSP